MIYKIGLESIFNKETYITINRSLIIVESKSYYTPPSRIMSHRGAMCRLELDQKLLKLCPFLDRITGAKCISFRFFVHSLLLQGLNQSYGIQYKVILSLNGNGILLDEPSRQEQALPVKQQAKWLEGLRGGAPMKAHRQSRKQPMSEIYIFNLGKVLKYEEILKLTSPATTSLAARKIVFASIMFKVER